jgi:dihydrofolate reductase
VQYGFGQVTYELMAHGLLDELRLWVYPHFVGTATTDDLLFRPAATTQLTLTGTRTLTNGIVIMSYEFTPAAG